MQALRMTKEEIIKSYQVNLGELSKKVKDNAKDNANSKADIAKQGSRADGHNMKMEKLTARVRPLERGEPRRSKAPRRAVLFEAYFKAMRPIRVWPVAGSTEEELWGNAGEFLHGPLAIPETDVGQDDIEAVFPVNDPMQPENIKDEVVVRFKDSKTRDMVMVNSVNLAACAGTRLELPNGLKGTFCLLSRFGIRLRAGHGEGTKRHVKFDDLAGSLYTNVKLPGDTKWTRVTLEMARSDLEASVREENDAYQKGLASKLISGPRERLHGPAAEARAPPPARMARAPASTETVPGPSGKRPRWSGPQRRQL